MMAGDAIRCFLSSLLKDPCLSKATSCWEVAGFFEK